MGLKDASAENYELAVKHRTQLARLEDALADNKKLLATVQEQVGKSPASRRRGRLSITPPWLALTCRQ